MKKVIDSYSINYVDEGNGDIVILLHGWGANLHCFDSLIYILKNKYRVIALDLPGFGDSDMLMKSFSVDDYVDIVAKFIDSFTSETNNKSIILIGHSYGGRIIIKLNNRSELPFNIDKNILIDAAGIKDKKDLKVKAKIFVFKTLKSIINTLPISKNSKSEIIDRYRRKFGSSDYKLASSFLRETLIKSVNEDLTKYLKNMKETLIIWGDKDEATPLYMAKIMEKEIKDSGLVVLNGGHFSFIEDNYKFISVIKSYLKL